MSHKVTFNIADSNANALGCDELAGEFNLGETERIDPIDASLLDAGAGTLAVAWLNYLKQRNQSEEFQFQPTGDGPQEDDHEIQELDLDSPAGGTFKLGDGTTWTADIAHDATPSTIQTALEGLYGAGNVEVENKIVFDEVGTTSWTVPDGINAVDVLVVAGGGGGGRYGGGGAGGLLFEEDYDVSGESAISVVVGDGGTGRNAADTSGGKGGNSSFGSLEAIGGGGGGGWDSSGASGQDGGSGGGGGSDDSLPAGKGTAGQGNDGGEGASGSSPFRGAGGGGAGEKGPDAGANASPGGDGLDYSSYFGSEYGENGWFSGGGAGAENADTDALQGGQGGGGNSGSQAAGRLPTPGQDNTGGGGGGAGREPAGYSSTDNKGGSGIVIIAWPKLLITFDLSVGDSGLVADFTGLT